MSLLKGVSCFALGGVGYVGLELLWRGRSHVSMFVAGGLCFVALLWLDGWAQPFWLKCLLAGLGITAVEFCIGCVVNVWLKLGVWDYSRLRFHVLGQVCLLYTVLWVGLSALLLGAMALWRGRLRPVL